jgi:hypothetical protein
MFSSMNITKGKNQSYVTDSHLDDALRAACSSYTPEFPQLAPNMLCQYFILIKRLVRVKFSSVIFIIIIIAIATQCPRLHSHQSDAPQYINTLVSTVLGL